MTQEISQNWGPLRTILRSKCTASLVRKLTGATGIDMSSLPKFAGTPSTGEYDELMLSLDQVFYSMNQDEQRRFLHIMVEELLRNKPDLKSVLESYFARLGWSLHNNTLVPVEIFDITDLPELPADAALDLVKATTRLRDGDLSGAVASACGAVDTVTTRIYTEKGIGDPSSASYQEKIKKSLSAVGSIDSIKQELIELGWSAQPTETFCKNLEGSINQASYVMQTLRSNMGDAHGTKPALKALAFDVIKWSTVILRLLKSK